MTLEQATEQVRGKRILLAAPSCADFYYEGYRPLIEASNQAYGTQLLISDARSSERADAVKTLGLRFVFACAGLSGRGKFSGNQYALSKAINLPEQVGVQAFNSGIDLIVSGMLNDDPNYRACREIAYDAAYEAMRIGKQQAATGETVKHVGALVLDFRGGIDLIN